MTSRGSSFTESALAPTLSKLSAICVAIWFSDIGPKKVAPTEQAEQYLLRFGPSAEPRSGKSTQRWTGIWSVLGMRLCRLNEILYLLRINAESVAARMQNNKNNHTATITSSICLLPTCDAEREDQEDDRIFLLAHRRGD